MGAKLVRDRMGDIPWRDEHGKKYLRPVTGPEEHMALLFAKLLEEAGELQACEGAEQVAEELADIYEVVDGIVALFVREGEFSPVEVREQLAKKRAERGGFEEGLVFDFSHYTA